MGGSQRGSVDRSLQAPPELDAGGDQTPSGKWEVLSFVLYLGPVGSSVRPWEKRQKPVCPEVSASWCLEQLVWTQAQGRTEDPYMPGLCLFSTKALVVLKRDPWGLHLPQPLTPAPLNFLIPRPIRRSLGRLPPSHPFSSPPYYLEMGPLVMASPYVACSVLNPVSRTAQTSQPQPEYWLSSLELETQCWHPVAEPLGSSCLDLCILGQGHLQGQDSMWNVSLNHLERSGTLIMFRSYKTCRSAVYMQF